MIFNDMDRYLKNKHSLSLSADPKLKLIKVINVSPSTAVAMLSLYSAAAGWHPVFAVTVVAFRRRSVCQSDQSSATPAGGYPANGINRNGERVVEVVIVKAG